MKCGRRSVVGLDLSLVSTGWVGFDGPGRSYRSGIIDTSKVPHKDGTKAELTRISTIATEVEALLGVLDNPLVVCEGFSFASRGRAIMQIGGLGYIVRDRLYRAGYQWIDIPPTEAKKFCTGKGTAEKSLMLKEVYKRWGEDFSDDNIADAFVLAMIGRALLGSWQPTTDFQKTIVRNVLKLHPELKTTEGRK